MPRIDPKVQIATSGFAIWVSFSNNFCSGAGEVMVVRGACLRLVVISVISFLINLLCTTAVHCSPEGFYDWRIYDKGTPTQGI